MGFKSFLVVLGVFYAGVCFSAPSSKKSKHPKNIKIEHMISYTIAKSRRAKNILEFSQNIATTQKQKTQYASFLKKEKLEIASIGLLERNEDMVTVQGAGLTISFKDLKKGFVEINGKSLQISKNDSIDDLYSKMKVLLSKKAFIRSIFFEEAFAADSFQAAISQTGLLIDSVERLNEACSNLKPYKDPNTYPQDTIIEACPLYDESHALFGLFNRETEFPVSIKCTGRAPDQRVQSIVAGSRVITFLYDKVTIRGRDKAGQANTTVSENGVEVCVKYGDVYGDISFANPGRVEVYETTTTTTTLNKQTCSDIVKYSSYCCLRPDTCLQDIAELNEEQKKAYLNPIYDSKYKNQPQAFPAPDSGNPQ